MHEFLGGELGFFLRNLRVFEDPVLRALPAHSRRDVARDCWKLRSGRGTIYLQVCCRNDYVKDPGVGRVKPSSCPNFCELGHG